MASRRLLLREALPVAPAGLGQATIRSARDDRDDRLLRRRRSGDARVARQPRRPRAAHVAGARRRPRAPTILVFDLDPGPPATIVECCARRAALREVFGQFGLEAFPKTSGSKGMQVYVPLNTPATYDQHASRSRAPGAAARAPRSATRGLRDDQGAAPRQGVRRLEPERRAQDHGVRVLAARARAPPSRRRSRGRRSRRPPNGRSRAPMFTSAEVLERVAEHGDLFAPVEKLEQELPEFRSPPRRGRLDAALEVGEGVHPRKSTPRPTRAWASSPETPVMITRVPSRPPRGPSRAAGQPRASRSPAPR